MGAGTNLAESNGRQKPAARSKFRHVIIKIGGDFGFWRAALRIKPCFAGTISHPSYRGSDRTFLPEVMVGLGPNRTAVPAQEFCGFLHRSPDCVRLGTCVAWLSHAVPRRPAGSRSGGGLGDSGLD